MLNNASLIVVPLTSVLNVTFLVTVPLIASLHSVLKIASLDIDPLLDTCSSDILNIASLTTDSLNNVLRLFVVGLFVHDRNSLCDAGYVFELLYFRGALMEWLDIGHRAWSASQVASGGHDR